MAGNSGEELFEADAYEPDDALMAAILGEHLPEGTGRDAEYQAAVADLGQLRLALRDLGDELAAEPAAEPEAAPPPVIRAKPVRVRTRRLFAVSVRVAVAACALALFGGLFWLGANNGIGGGADSGAAKGADFDAPSGADDSDDKGGAAESQSRAPDSESEAAQGEKAVGRAQQIACAKVLVEGEATKVVVRRDGAVDVTVEVDRWYRPERSVAEHPTTTVRLPARVASGIEVGELVLITVPIHVEDAYDAEQGWGVGDVRPELLAALPDARELDCPKPLTG
ncbi:hypothetical protein H9Y04_36745 [Streptomyces sp. TRM66268-LWL]|uniref:Uncharacterized protein n=1 Tax=Streptomyces polyasparticus TaxID=2767826 RepID=A0ABR7SRF7_9ACTN|nr:hypothetical protein [Streptomyces polyasparticus]MBC9718095.1 hypothetical protein [Streptomyces polyasparticus]